MKWHRVLLPELMLLLGISAAGSWIGLLILPTRVGEEIDLDSGRVYKFKQVGSLVFQGTEVPQPYYRMLPINSDSQRVLLPTLYTQHWFDCNRYNIGRSWHANMCGPASGVPDFLTRMLGSCGDREISQHFRNISPGSCSDRLAALEPEDKELLFGKMLEYFREEYSLCQACGSFKYYDYVIFDPKDESYRTTEEIAATLHADDRSVYCWVFANSAY
jgi:hypothetical protein